jgi:hypothetical protein
MSHSKQFLAQLHFSISTVANVGPEVRYGGRIQNAFFGPSNKSRLNHPTFSKATSVTTTDDDDDDDDKRKCNHTQTLSANERNQSKILT